MIRLLLCLATVAIVLAGANVGRAEEAAAPAPPPAPAPAAAAPAPPAPAAQNVTALVRAAEGTVETRPAVGQPWTPVKAGTSLAEGADLRTGFRGRCILDMGESLVEVDSLTVVRLGELRQDGGRIHARVYLKQGTAQAVVVKKDTPSDFAIVTPSATLSVRGTRGIKCQFFPDTGGEYGLADAGLIQLVNDLLRRLATLRPGEQTDDSLILPADFLAWLRQPQVLDLFTFLSDERWANIRWHTSTLTPAGLNGPTGPQTLNVFQTLPSNPSPYPPDWPK
jgi:hypothetical protein